MKALALVLALAVGLGAAHAQEPQLATFQEVAQIIIDGQDSSDVTASITLQSTSAQEMRVPAELEQKILSESLVSSVIVTNEESCVLGVADQACIMVNVDRSSNWTGIDAIQEGARQVGDTLIGDLNDLFGTGAQFHSVFVHQDGQASQMLDTSGAVVGRGTISAVYTMPMQDTQSMYAHVSELLVHQVIRDSGGFYDVAVDLSEGDLSKTTLSMISLPNSLLYQLRIVANHEGAASDIDWVRPLEYLQTGTLQRSQYFDEGFYPLNSLLHVVVFASEPVSVVDVEGSVLPFEVVRGDRVPTDIAQAGWVFDPDSGRIIDGKFIFGRTASVGPGALGFALGAQDQAPVQGQISESEEPGSYDGLIVLGIIVAVGAAASYYYFKGYRSRPARQAPRSDESQGYD